MDLFTAAQLDPFQQPHLGTCHIAGPEQELSAEVTFLYHVHIGDDDLPIAFSSHAHACQRQNLEQLTANGSGTNHKVPQVPQLVLWGERV